MRHSDLYDEKLSMYKVNASLQNASFELGRQEPSHLAGWRMSPSGFIWNIKYLLELIQMACMKLLRISHKARDPILDKEVYGRSIYENSSFIGKQ